MVQTGLWTRMWAGHIKTTQTLVAGALTVLLAATGCVEPQNPCDPDADESIRRTATLSGKVVDEDGAPVVNVGVLLVEQNQTVFTGEDGAFKFIEVLPSGTGYTLAALPASPAVGGRLHTGPLGCASELDVDDPLVVVNPPPPPEVEITAATSPERMFVAFASTLAEDEAAGHADCADPKAVAAGEHSYRPEVRETFGQWEPALVSLYPSLPLESDDDLARAIGDGLVVEAMNDGCAQQQCADFAYAFRELETEADVARCLEIVGSIKADGSPRRLEHYGQLQVRVRSDLKATANAERQQVPQLVPSVASALPKTLSLVPQTIMPVSLANDLDVADQLEAGMNVGAIVPVGADGRFALINHDGIMVVNNSRATAEMAAEAGMADAPEGAMGVEDDVTDTMAEEVGQGQGQALAILPAGNWVRVWKRVHDAGGASSSMVDNVFVGTDDKPQGVQPAFEFDVTQSRSPFRKFAFLSAPTGDPRGPEYNQPPPDYMLLFKDGFVLTGLSEGENMSDMATAMDDDGMMDAAWSAPSEAAAAAEEPPTGIPGEDFVPLGQGGFCDDLGTAGHHTDGDGDNASSRVDVCFNVSDAMGDEVNFVDIGILTEEGLTAADHSASVHLIADQAGDRLIAVNTQALLHDMQNSVLESMTHLSVGVDPIAMHPSQQLECDESDTLVGSTPVMLVANAGSEDISVVAFTDDSTNPDLASRLREMNVVPVGGVPVGFLTDLTGPTCNDPFVWVRTDDGTMYPIDMRTAEAPVCGDATCRVATRSRSPAGAVAHMRDAQNNDVGARVLVGGRGMLGELGFLRPTYGATNRAADAVAEFTGADVGSDDDAPTEPAGDDESADEGTPGPNTPGDGPRQ